MDIVLVAGLWLPRSVWDEVVAELDRRGHRPIAVALPGADGGPDPTTTLDDQLAAVLAAVDAADRPMVVGHSAASTLAWLAADRRPDRVAGVALVGGFPSSPGSAYAQFFPVVDRLMPFPGWDPFDGPDSADLDHEARRHLAGLAVPVSGLVASGVVSLTDERRFEVPTVVICPEYGPDDVRAWLEAGDLPELTAAGSVELVDLDSGHWPMVTRPDDLAALLDQAAAGLS